MARRLDEGKATQLARALTERFGDPIPVTIVESPQGPLACEACGRLSEEMDGDVCSQCGSMPPRMSQAMNHEKVDAMAELDEEAPPGREDQVKALKHKKGVKNPWAVAWASYNRSS